MFGKKKRIFIGDSGTVVKPDLMTVIITLVCNITVVGLLILGILAYIHA